MLVRIVDAAEALAELALHAGDASKASWACEKARLMEPHREATHLLRMRAYALLGDRDSGAEFDSTSYVPPSSPRGRRLVLANPGGCMTRTACSP